MSIISGHFFRFKFSAARRLVCGFLCALTAFGFNSTLQATPKTVSNDFSTPTLMAAANFRQLTRLTANDGANGDWFGSSVAVSGDTAVVGAFNDDAGATDSGSVYVYVRTGAAWTQQARLTASDAAAGDALGISVAIAGDTIIAGAYLDNTGANANQGAAYIFTRANGVWTQQAKLTADDGAFEDLFGVSVAIEGDTAIVGATGDDAGASFDVGSAYVFKRSGATWTQQQKLTATGGLQSDFFGMSVAIAGDRAIVGAWFDDINETASDQGSAYVFTRAGDVWTQTFQLTADDAAGSDRFGTSVAMSGDTIIVGAHLEDTGSTSSQGAAYVFTRTAGAAWTQQAKLLAADPASGDVFGWSVGISGDTAVVGAYGDDVDGIFDAGSAYVFKRAGATWTQTGKLTASDRAEADYFGYDVAIGADAAIFGAYNDNAPAEDSGSGYIFTTRTTPFDFDGDLRADIGTYRAQGGGWFLLNSGSNNAFSATQFGIVADKIAPADFDGDGRTDIAVFRPENGVWYVLRSTLGFTSVFFGAPEDVPVPGDYDGDGIADFAVFRNGVWFVQQSRDGFRSFQFGAAADRPLVGDFDGDGRTDFTVYRDGLWYIQQSQAGFLAAGFGIATDKAAPADYDGDGRTDLAVFRPSNGVWYLQRSTAGFTSLQFGADGDIPAPADFDGDGRADVTVYRVNNWFIGQSANGFLSVPFGGAEDKPVSSAFVR